MRQPSAGYLHMIPFVALARSALSLLRCCRAVHPNGIRGSRSAQGHERLSSVRALRICLSTDSGHIVALQRKATQGRTSDSCGSKTGIFERRSRGPAVLFTVCTVPSCGCTILLTAAYSMVRLPYCSGCIGRDLRLSRSADNWLARLPDRSLSAWDWRLTPQS
jgi:hypothetical protein